MLGRYSDFCLNQAGQVPNVLQLADFRGREAHFIGFLDGQHQTDIPQAIPARHVLRGHGRTRHQGVIAKNIAENLRQLQINITRFRFQSASIAYWQLEKIRKWPCASQTWLAATPDGPSPSPPDTLSVIPLRLDRDEFDTPL